MILLISASRVAGIAGVRHWCLVTFYNFLILREHIALQISDTKMDAVRIKVSKG
jgi:hypothetical protein